MQFGTWVQNTREGYFVRSLTYPSHDCEGSHTGKNTPHKILLTGILHPGPKLHLPTMASLIWGPLIQASLYTGVLYTSQNGVPYTGSLNTGVPKYRRPIYRRPYVRDLTKYHSRVFCTQVPNCTFLAWPMKAHVGTCRTSDRFKEV